MRKIILFLIVSIFIIGFVGCVDEKNDSLYHSEYDLYYQYKNSFKGIELYCYEQDGKYYGCLIGGTNRLKTVDEIKKLQEEYPCPIDIMKDILLTYSDEDRKYISIIIVSNPPKQEELTHSLENNEKNAEIISQINNLLGLKGDTSIEDILITPSPSSGMIYAKKSEEIQLSFDIYPSNATYTNVSWYSTDTSIVTVSSDGLAKCVNSGNATIVVAVDGVVASIPFIITEDKQEMKYELTITGSKNMLISYPKESSYQTGEELIIKSGIIMDASLYVYLNDEKVEMSYEDDYWVFKCTMPEQDSVLHITMDQFYGKEEFTFNELFYFTKNLTTDNVGEISISSRNSDASPDTLTTITYTKDINDIKNILSMINEKLIICNEQIAPGYLHKTYTFYCNDDMYEIVLIDDLVYWYGFSSSRTFKFDRTGWTIPTISNGYQVTYKFEYAGIASKLYNSETKELINDRFYGIESFEFIECDEEYTIDDAKYYLEGQNGIQYIIDAKHFIFNEKCYEIISEYDFTLNGDF